MRVARGFGDVALVALPPLERWLARPIPERADGTTEGVARAGQRGVGPAPGESEDEPDARMRQAVEAAKWFIEEHLAEPIDITCISRQVELGRPHFTRVFCAIEGTPPWAHGPDRRARRAAELLRTNRPLTEVALDSGF